MIPLSVPNLDGNEWKYIKDCLDTNWVSSVGSYVNRFEEMIAEYSGAKYAIAISNGTSALHISLMLAGVVRNDLVIVPNITFIASVNAITYCGADPVLMDVKGDTWQMDLDLLEEFLSEQTAFVDGQCIHKASGRAIRTIMPVHVLGNMCDMDRLTELASEYGLNIVEDSTEALGSFYKGKSAGTFGLLGTFSFNGNKIISTGGGGMVVTNDDLLGKKAKHLTTQAKADPLEYYHDEIGYNYRLVNILAAMGVAQMEQLPGFVNRKHEISKLYNDQLSGLEGVAAQKMGEHVEANHWLYTATFPQQRDLLNYLIAAGVQARPFWVPMNQLPMFRDQLYFTKENVSDKVYGSCISLPCSTSITDDEIMTVTNLIKDFYHKKG